MIPSNSTQVPNDEGFKESELATEMDLASTHGPLLTERGEPSPGREPLSIWLMVVFFGIIFWGGLYLAYNSGGFRSDVYNPDLVAWGGGGPGGNQTAAPDPKVIGKRIFSQNCVVCHQVTGEGVAGQFPPLVGSEWVLGGEWHGDNHLVSIVLHGLQGPVQVKGAAYNNAMPPWNQLSDEQIAAVLTYIRSEWGNAAPPITADYVKTLREKTAPRTEPWTQKELQAIPAEKAPAGGSLPAPAAPAASPTPAA